jgi:hypothetical protein
MALCLGSSGCGLFTAQVQTHIVYAGFAIPDEAAKGAVKVATNDKILCTVEGDTNTSAYMNLAGWYLISPADLKAFVALAREKANAPR